MRTRLLRYIKTLPFAVWLCYMVFCAYLVGHHILDSDTVQWMVLGGSIPLLILAVVIPEAISARQEARRRSKAL